MRRCGTIVVPAIVALCVPMLAVIVSCFPGYTFATAEADGSNAGDAGYGPEAMSDASGDNTVPPGDDAAPDTTAGDDGGPETATGDDGANETSTPPGDGATEVAPPSDAAPPNAMVPITGGSFDFVLNGGPSGPSVHETLDYNFEIDAYEVTVARFKAWVDQQMPLPCSGGGTACALDTKPPYLKSMVWNPLWIAQAQSHDYTTGPDCGNEGPPSVATYLQPNASALAVTCVNWAQAVAFCAFEGKRLPTIAEWYYVATGAGVHRSEYPWGSAPPDCTRAILALNGGNCGYPNAAGTAQSQISGVFDLIGGVDEWAWDSIDSNLSYPPTGIDYAGRSYDGGVGARGSFWIKSAFDDTPATLDSLGVSGAMPDYGWSDLGFRCARTQ
jgi:formylglycine-generating enzyme required for sulfatase activity